MKKELFDIVIAVGPDDKNIIKEQINFTKKNIIGYRNIYLISYDPKIKIKNCITINENIFPFSKKTVKKYHGENKRNGWYLQQLLKLYAGFIISDILERYLVIDSDTFFLKPTEFIQDNKCLYNYCSEYHKPYFDHMKKLDNSLEKLYIDKSGICHHMIFETKKIKELIEKIEKNHSDKFYNLFLKFVDKKDILKSGASEYEIYFNYIFKNYPNEIKLRKLKWIDTDYLDINNNKNCDYISQHFFARKRKEKKKNS